MDTDENKVVAESAGETVTPQANPPQAEVPSTGEQTTPSESGEVSDNSIQTEEERREFQIQRLAEENRRLKQEKEARLKSESAFDVFRPKTVETPFGQPAVIDISRFTDQFTGETNWVAYNQERDRIVKQQATTEARQAVREELDEQQARTKYPELFGNPAVEQRIADRWIASKLRGNEVSITELAEEESKLLSQAVSKAEKIGAEKTLEALTPKEQASLAATGQASSSARQASSEEELERLRQQSRGRGRESEQAIAARMKAIPYQQ